MPVVIPELVYIVGLFFAIVGYLAARGLLATWTHTIGYLLEWLGSQADISVRSHGLGFTIPFGKPFRAADKFVVTAIQNWCDGAEIEMGYCLHGLQKVASLLAQAVDILARETTQTFDWLVGVHLPKWARYALGPLLLPFLIPKLLAALAPHVGTRIAKTVQVVTHDVTHEVVRVVRRAVGGAVAFPPWVIRLPHRLRGVEGDVNRLTRRLHKVEGIAAAAVFAGLLANVLGIATKCVRGGNVGKVARRLCGLDSSLVDLLLLDTLAILGAVSVVEFAKGLQAIEGEAVTILGDLITEFPSS